MCTLKFYTWMHRIDQSQNWGENTQIAWLMVLGDADWLGFSASDQQAETYLWIAFKYIDESLQSDRDRVAEQVRSLQCHLPKPSCPTKERPTACCGFSITWKTYWNSKHCLLPGSQCKEASAIILSKRSTSLIRANENQNIGMAM